MREMLQDLSLHISHTFWVSLEKKKNWDVGLTAKAEEWLLVIDILSFKLQNDPTFWAPLPEDPS